MELSSRFENFSALRVKALDKFQYALYTVCSLLFGSGSEAQLNLPPPKSELRRK
jgi:hypothetical protein